MPATIKIKNSSTAGAAPTASDLVQGELAVNVTDKRLYTENSGGTIVELGTNPSIPVTFPDGSASAPSLTNAGDTNTGIFFPAADTIAFAEGGTETMRLDSAGNMGLGVTPSAWRTAGGEKALQIGTGLTAYSNSGGDVYWNKNWFLNSSSQSIYLNNGYAQSYGMVSGEHRWYNAASGTAGNAITFTQAMTLDASGNLGVGTTSPACKADVNGMIRAQGSTISASGEGLELIYTASTPYFGATNTAVVQAYNRSGSAFTPLVLSASQLAFATGGTERARIDSSGNLLVGKTTTSATSGAGVQFQPSGYVNAVTASSTNSFSTYELYSTGAGAYRFFVGAGGTVYATSTTISSLSDARYKENIRDLNVGLAEVMALKPRLYDWKEGKGADIKNARGFIAQEFEEVFPDLIDEWRDPAPEGEEPYKSVRADLIPVLVKAIQELKTELDAAKARITALEQA